MRGHCEGGGGWMRTVLGTTGCLAALAGCDVNAPQNHARRATATSSLKAAGAQDAKCPGEPQGIGQGVTCPGLHVVALRKKSKDACASISTACGSWKGQETMIADSQVYCSYAWQGNAPPDYRPFDSFAAAAVDCPVVVPLATRAQWLEPMRDLYRRQSGWVTELPPLRARTRVAVVDTAALPYDSPQQDNYAHGRAVGRVIADIACPGTGGCASDIRNYLALAQQTHDKVDEQRGGHFGTRAQLARAIAEAVREYQRDALVDPQIEHLIINLSLGWDPRHGGASAGSAGAELGLPSKVVHDALNQASCAGALIMVAAGNGLKSTDVGPMYPAGWETLPAPDPSLCKSLGAKHVNTRGGYRPLVYAVDAVDHSDQLLATARPGAQPRRVAYGIGVVTNDRLRGGYTQPLSGTSMSTAVVSGIAAAVWAMDPRLSPHELLERIEATGPALKVVDPASGQTIEAAVCLGGNGCPQKPIRRVSACAALQKTQATLGVPSDARLRCGTIAAHGGRSLVPGFRDPRAETPNQLAQVTSTCPVSGCPGLAASPTSPLVEPWVAPQPDPPSCEHCILWRPWRYLTVQLAPGRATPAVVNLGVYMPYFSSIQLTGPFPRFFGVSVPTSPSAIHAWLDMAYTNVGQIIRVREPVLLH